MLRQSWQCGLKVQVVKTLPLRNFSTSNINYGTKAIKFLKAQKKRQKNEAKQASSKTNMLETVDPVLGRKDVPFITRIMAELKEPGKLSMGYNIEEVEKLIAAVDPAESLHLSSLSDELKSKDKENETALKREAILRILNLKNSNSSNAMKLALKYAREEFQRFPGDTGSSEVQAACMTIRIFFMVKHIKANHKDFANIRRLRILVQQRQSILRYLRRDNAERYYWAIQKLGLTDSAILHEFNLDRQYMQDFKLFGDKILVKSSKNKSSQQHKE
ncbi:hypothetical protein TBLA_0A03350 [Henningerozyma blattae CBS 6284]|uniref:Ribosomal protein S15 n=1 Tax=Henningerozyma blattae (strain ATCC 34711 / CBS 6284 / DSM 70876 / NBRC 10599 / NRRL Y-10934 / UCD 77-7) TaxID=1071380 RepID=I2GVI3_HENB6|nr:hypothetical protein TBLA_0A03350 [Tetrapisispora blattae CBS 6284]CCH58135.1 hypothetical protein TBLA_0A03350 [Tetrapisispora blattae CBS 6284]